MSLTQFRRGGLVACLTALCLVVAAPVADADDHGHGHGRGHAADSEPLDIEADYISPDTLITDDAEAQIPPGTDTGGCTYESVQTGVNAQPSSPSFQLLYVVPSDVTAVASMDVPRSCTDGRVLYSGLARTSRNMASFLAAEGTGMNYRTMNITYTHNWTGNNYSTRGVRRFRSAYSLSEWNALKLYVAPACSTCPATSPRLERLREELGRAGFRVTSTKYMAMLHAAAQVKTCNAAGSCSHTVGIAETGGTYGMTIRYREHQNGPRNTYRYGCGTDGDVIFAHEQTHMQGAKHVTDSTYDLMQAVKPSATFISSPRITWDYGWNNYHNTVRSNAYTSLAAQSGNYFTC